MNEVLRDALDNIFDARVPNTWRKISWENATLGFWYVRTLIWTTIRRKGFGYSHSRICYGSVYPSVLNVSTVAKISKKAKLNTNSLKKRVYLRSYAR